jgi:hypothetical protein
MCCLPLQSYQVLIFIFCISILQELKRERAKAALAIKSLQEKMDEKLKLELEQKVHINFC